MICRMVCVLVLVSLVAEVHAEEAEVVIYGGTSAGIMAGVQVRQMGKSVIVIEPTDRIGGLTTGGLGQTDIGNKEAIGGLSREFYRRVRSYYADAAHWRWQKPEQYQDGGQTTTKSHEDAMWTFEPSAALAILQGFVDEYELRVVYGQRLDRREGVEVVDRRITSIRMEDGTVYRGKVFIDATYEGDLLATSGVSYVVGRESIEDYGEKYAGVQTNGPRASNHNFMEGVDPFVVKGDPGSGLLPMISREGPGVVGAADGRIQAYCYRMCLTDHAENRVAFKKPEGYDAVNYELLFRNFEAGEMRIPWNNSAMPNRKTDTNNTHGFSTDFIGGNYDYPEADYALREQIIGEHLRFQQGLMWTLANHERVPEKIRREVSRWGTCKDEFVNSGGWPGQLYIREARRMVGPVVMQEKHCEGREVVEDAIGLAAYGMDSHHVQRYVTVDGAVRNEGNIQAKVSGPYPISYRSIVPRSEECENLLVPVCLSSTHIAFGSIRMEPVFMILGQSAATAAVMSVENQTSVQGVDYRLLRERLLSDQQVLDR